MAKQQLVLAFFENEAAADQAVDGIKQWDKASKEIKLGAIGVLVKDDKGKIKTHKLGKRKTGTGAVLFGLAAVLTGGATLLAGAVFGGIVGSFFRKGLGMSRTTWPASTANWTAARRPCASWPLLTKRPPYRPNWPSWVASRSHTSCRKKSSKKPRQPPRRCLKRRQPKRLPKHRPRRRPKKKAKKRPPPDLPRQRARQRRESPLRHAPGKAGG